MVIKILMMSACIIDGCHSATVGELNPPANLTWPRVFFNGADGSLRANDP